MKTGEKKYHSLIWGNYFLYVETINNFRHVTKQQVHKWTGISKTVVQKKESAEGNITYHIAKCIFKPFLS